MSDTLPGMSRLASTASWRPTGPVLGVIALHPLALLCVLLQPALWPWAVGGVLAGHGLITALSLWPRTQRLGPNMIRLPDAAAKRMEVALTIDDGPAPDVTSAVLDLLDAYGAKATFFCIGQRAAAHPDLCREIVRRGHAVENHTAHHRHTFALLGPQAYLAELLQGQITLEAITGVAPVFFRPPGGFRNPFLWAALARLNLRLASWTRRGFDTAERDPAVVLRRLLHQVRAGDILLLHDGNAAHTPAGRPVILEVLPALLSGLQASGLKSVTLRSACGIDPCERSRP